MPVERIAAFVRGASRESFDTLALAAFAFQYERIAPYRVLCDRLGVTPETVGGWRRVPAVPALAVAVTALAAAEPVERFRSSGGDTPALHHQPYPDLLRAVLDRSFPEACLAAAERPPVLSLVPPREVEPASSHAFMAEHSLARWAAPDSRVASSRRGVEVAQARSFLAARQRDRRPPLLLASAETLGRLLEALERRGLRFRLPAGSRLVVTGGGEVLSRELLERLAVSLAVGAEAVIRDYAPPALTSRFYAGHDAAGGPLPFRPPPWTRVRVIDPDSFAEMPSGGRGLVAVLDLANLGSAIHLLTGELGVAVGDGFSLAGRAGGDELARCSRIAAEMAAAASG